MRREVVKPTSASPAASIAAEDGSGTAVGNSATASGLPGIKNTPPKTPKNCCGPIGIRVEVDCPSWSTARMIDCDNMGAKPALNE